MKLSDYKKVLQYFSQSTRVLHWEYWSTLTGVLEYFRRSTGPFVVKGGRKGVILI